MIKLPFRYALSSVYAKLVIDDLFLAIQAAASIGWHNTLIFFDPAMQYLFQQRMDELNQYQTDDVKRYVKKNLKLDEDTEKVVKEVCVDLKAGEIKVIMWNRMNAGYVFRRIFLPAEWKDFLSENELKAIVGHELGHLKMNTDSYVPMRLVNRMGDEFLYTLLPVHTTGYFFVLMTLISQNPAYIKALSLTVLYRIAHLLIDNFMTRKDEFKADQYGKKVSDSSSMISALTKIEQRARVEIFENLYRLPLCKQFYYRWLLIKDKGILRECLLDHPFLHKRVQALKV